MPQTKTIYVMFRKAAFLPCAISGFPAPTVYWTVTHQQVTKNVTVASLDEVVRVLADGTSFTQQSTVYDNGTLHISEVSAADTLGRFQCTAINHLGSAYGNVSLVLVKGRTVKQFCQYFCGICQLAIIETGAHIRLSLRPTVRPYIHPSIHPFR